MLKIVIIFYFHFMYIIFSTAWATPIPPDKTPQTLHTSHFEIIYYAEQQELAQHYALQLEKAWTFLDSIFPTKPQDRIVVVINDSTDLSNGFATRVPYPYMMLYPVLPDLNDSLSEYENWSLELAVHELAHVLSFEPAHGVMKPLRSVFGSIIAPNILLPTWWKEGLSVWTETAIGQGGRLRSIYQESILRAWYGEKNFLNFTVAQANEILPEWPLGSRPYLFGSLVMSSLLEKKGEAVLAEIVELHGQRVPYMLKGATQPTLGKTYEEFYNESLKDWESRTARQIETLSQQPFDQPIQVLTQDLSVRSPTISGDGTYIAWVGQDERYYARLKVSKLLASGNLGPIQELTHDSIREARFFPRSHKILYNAIKSASQSELYSDFYIYDLETRKKKRLTRQIRGREGQVSPDETQIVFVGLEGGKTHLRLLNIETQNLTTLISTQFDQRIATPLFLDRDHILFSWTIQGQEHLHTFNLQTQEIKLFTNFSKRVRRPSQINGKLFYLADKNKVFNLYNHQTHSPLTHIKTNVLDYAIHPQRPEMFAVLMTSSGPRLFQFPHFDTSKVRDSLPQAEPLQKSFTNLKPPALESIESQKTERSYRLWPHYWIPFISGSSASEGALLSISTSGQDPTLQHAYEAQVTYDTGVEETSYGLQYTNRTMTWPWLLSSVRLARNFAGSELIYYNQFHAISIQPDTSSLTDDWGTTLSYLYAKYEDDYREYERHGPQLNFAYSNARQTIFMISPEEGWEAAANWTHFLKSSQIEGYNQYRMKGNLYWSHWLPNRHAISIETRALVTDKKIPSILGDSSTIYSSPLTSNYLIRGYQEGQFTGRNISNANIEYRFPILPYAKGNGLFPFYVKRVHGAIAFDALAADGFAYKESTNNNVQVEQKDVFSSGGLELRADTTVGYVLPIQWVAGAHYPLQPSYSKNPNFQIQVRSGFTF